MALIHGQEKVYSHGCAVTELEQRYCPQAMGSGGEVEQTG